MFISGVSLSFSTVYACIFKIHIFYILHKIKYHNVGLFSYFLNRIYNILFMGTIRLDIWYWLVCSFFFQIKGILEKGVCMGYFMYFPRIIILFVRFASFMVFFI